MPRPRKHQPGSTCTACWPTPGGKQGEVTFCGKPVQSTGLCISHYQRGRRYKAKHKSATQAQVLAEINRPLEEDRGELEQQAVRYRKATLDKLRALAEQRGTSLYAVLEEAAELVAANPDLLPPLDE